VSERERDQEDPKAAITLVVAIIGALAILVLILALQAMFYSSQEAERGNKVNASDPADLSRLRAQQLEQLNGYRWIDPSKGLVAIPIDQAMELTVRDQGVLPALTGARGAATAAPTSPAGAKTGGAGNGKVGGMGNGKASDKANGKAAGRR